VHGVDRVRARGSVFFFGRGAVLGSSTSLNSLSDEVGSGFLVRCDDRLVIAYRRYLGS